MTISAAQKMVKARANLVMGHPFFGTLSLRLKMVEDNTIQSAACDGVTLRYNAKFVEGLPLSKVQGLVAHEVMHPAFLHHTRRAGRDKKKWNQACDHSINTILKNAGFDLPDGKYSDPSYNGMTAEHIYKLLPDDPKDPDGGGQGDDDSKDGDVGDNPNGNSQSEQMHEEAEWKIAMAQAAHVAKQAGKLPADLERMMGDLFESKLPWRSILRRFMTERANDDFTWKKGNRRFIAQGLYLPSRESEASGEMVVVIDTSGSIGEKELTEFGNEIQAIVQDVRPTKTHVLYCDTRIAHADVFGPDDDLEFKAHGGGGTDFRPPFDWVDANNISPKCLVYLTDGYGPFPEHEASYPTLWCINNHDVNPPHGEHLIMDV